MSLTATQYATITGLSASQARMRLEWMTAAGMAERHTYDRRRTTFTLLDEASAEPVRVHLKDEVARAASAAALSETMAQRLLRIIGFVRSRTDGVTAAEVRRNFGYQSLQFAHSQMKILKRRGLVDMEVIGKIQHWRVVA